MIWSVILLKPQLVKIFQHLRIWWAVVHISSCARCEFIKEPRIKLSMSHQRLNERNWTSVFTCHQWDGASNTLQEECQRYPPKTEGLNKIQSLRILCKNVQISIKKKSSFIIQRRKISNWRGKIETMNYINMYT